MNNFQTTQSGGGLLKPAYEGDALGKALKRRREALTQTVKQEASVINKSDPISRAQNEKRK